MPRASARVDWPCSGSSTRCAVGTRTTRRSPTRWALDRLAERFGRRLPTGLIGHSLGGRAALLSIGAPEVRSCVALAPWVRSTDFPDGDPEGCRVLIVHGSRDRIADPARSLALARRLAARTPVRYVRVEGGKHAMLKHHEEFDGLAARFTAATLLGLSDADAGYETPLPPPL